MNRSRSRSVLIAGALAALLLAHPLLGEPVITVVPGQGVSWKSIFDAGFRPKHQLGLERRNTLWFGPGFGARVGEHGEVFRLGPGRLLIEVQTDATVRMIWHQSSERLTFAEGEKRAAAFRKAFEPYITQELTMPTRMGGPGGLVDAGEEQHNVGARIGEWIVSYGFDSSYEVERPLVPHFYIAHNFPGRKKPRVATMEDRVEPPPDYEWYSLDPDVDTPDPQPEDSQPTSAAVRPPLGEGKVVDEPLNSEAKSEAHRNPGSASRAETSQPDTPSIDEEGEGTTWPLVLGAIAVLGVAIILVRAFMRGRAS